MRIVVAMALAVLLGACGGAAPSASRTTPVSAARKSAPQAEPPLLGHNLARAAVRDVVSRGLGSFLQYVDVADQPVLAGGKFHGFRIEALRDAPFWRGVDLRPGDVVTAVNGFPIEHPEEAQTAFDSLEVSSELRVTYERDGQARELVYAIVDAP